MNGINSSTPNKPGHYDVYWMEQVIDRGSSESSDMTVRWAVVRFFISLQIMFFIFGSSLNICQGFSTRFPFQITWSNDTQNSERTDIYGPGAHVDLRMGHRVQQSAVCLQNAALHSPCSDYSSPTGASVQRQWPRCSWKGVGGQGEGAGRGEVSLARHKQAHSRLRCQVRSMPGEKADGRTYLKLCGTKWDRK